MNPALQLPSTMQLLERGWLSSNNVVFRGAAAALVDSGYGSHAPQTVALVQHALQGQPLSVLVNTHLHSNHCGGNAALQNAFACRTMIPAAEAAKVAAWDEAALSFAACGQRCERFGFDATIAPGDSLVLGDIDWQVIAAPGHDPHEVMLYAPEERILISADALWENGFGVIFPELVGEPGFDAARATLELVATLEIKLVIPGHGALFADAGAALERAFSRIDYLAADPERNARNGIKVLLKFLLLERQRIALATLPQLLCAIPLIWQANLRYLAMTPEQLAEWTATQLVNAGVATIASGDLVNCG